jgi:hypothetical protein
MDNDNLFTDFNNQRHAVNRRKVASLYSMTSMLKWEHCVDESTRALLPQFKIFAQSHEPINLQLWLQYFAFDTISLITVRPHLMCFVASLSRKRLSELTLPQLNKSFGLVAQGRDEHGFLDALHAYLIYSANVGVYSELHPILGRLVSLLPSKGMAWMVSFVQGQVRTRIEQVGPEKYASAEENDFLGTILRMHGQNPDKIQLADVNMYPLTNIGAGSDTTSVSLAGIMYNLIISPDKLQRVRDHLEFSCLWHPFLED